MCVVSLSRSNASAKIANEQGNATISTTETEWPRLDEMMFTCWTLSPRPACAYAFAKLSSASRTCHVLCAVVKAEGTGSSRLETSRSPGKVARRMGVYVYVYRYALLAGTATSMGERGRGGERGRI